ncbi:MAG: hypothetical protein AAGG51_01425 [Cyanobacteria bacterium P01_G01_bin.54]
MQHLKFTALLCGLSLLIGCGPSRQAQCQLLGEAQNQVRNTINAQYQQRIGQLAYSQTHELQMVQVMQQAAETTQAVQLKDANLQDLQTRLVQSYQNSSQLHQQAANLIPATGSPNEAVIQQVDALHQQVDAGIPEAVQEFNIYCIGG